MAEGNAPTIQDPAPSSTATPPVEMTPRQASRLEGVPAEAAAIMKARKVERAGAAGKAGAAPVMAAALPGAKPEAGKKANAPLKEEPGKSADAEKIPGAIVFGADTAEGGDEGGGDDELPEGDVVIEGLTDEAKKKLADLNHKTQGFRRRTQAAETTAKEAALKATEQEAQTKALQQELETLRTAPRGNNWLAWTADPKQIQLVEANANAGLRILQKAMLDPDAPREHTFPDGSKRDLTADDLDMLTTYVDHAEERRDQLVKHGKSQDEAKKLLAKVSTVPGFDKLHQAALKADWDNDRPTLAVKMALAELLLGGQYQLVPLSAKKTLEKATGATSPDLKTVGEAPKPAANTTGSPPPKIATSMPKVTQGGTDYDALLSTAQARAATGDETAVREMLRIKRERREAQRRQ